MGLPWDTIVFEIGKLTQLGEDVCCKNEAYNQWDDKEFKVTL